MSGVIPRSAWVWLVGLACLLVAGGSGCNDGGGSGGSVPAETSSADASTASEAVDPAPPPAPADLPEIECPPGLVDCETAGGEILYVERVDPDGDGDAHFVLLSREGITAPGISVIDVRTDLRPDPLPGPGDLLAAAGVIYEGSYGQRQIQAEAVAFDRVR